MLAVILGVATLRQGGAVLLGDADAVRSAGKYVPFVVWFNVLAAFAYVAAGVGLWLRRRWAAGLAFAIAIATLAAFVAFGIHVAGGGGYELRTVFAMSVRMIVWFAIALLSYRLLRPAVR
ncbi:MAG: hypothetical protein BroJett029_18270 [Alphaproteobacteria bacterium]|nr:MAG: hypothetical protein BroJett029_18270 [Alphaproteobacteria bacterium]